MISARITKNFDTKYIRASFAIQLPTNRLIDKKCNQKIRRNASLEKRA